MRKLPCFVLITVLISFSNVFAAWELVPVKKDECYMAEYGDLYVKSGTMDEFKTLNKSRGTVAFWKVIDSTSFLFKDQMTHPNRAFRCELKEELRAFICHKIDLISEEDLYLDCIKDNPKSACRLDYRKFYDDELCLITDVAANYKQRSYAKNYEPSWGGQKAELPEPEPQQITKESERAQVEALTKSGTESKILYVPDQSYNGCWLSIRNESPDDIRIEVNYVKMGILKARHNGYMKVSCNSVSLDIYPQGINFQKTAHEAYSANNIRHWNMPHVIDGAKVYIKMKGFLTRFAYN